MKRRSENTEYQEERLMALITLGVQEKSPPGDCPSEEQLAAFAEGRLKNDKREMILGHLIACPSCYRQWLDISFFAPVATEKVRKTRTSGMSSVWWHRLCISFPLAAAACLIFFLITPIPLANQIARSYQSVLAQNISFRAGEQPLAFGLPWEEPQQRFAFGTSARHDPENRAFGAGLWSGRQRFSETRPPTPMPDILSPKWQGDPTDAAHWSETQYGIYFSMGRWCFLLRTVCLSDKGFSQSFWEQQRSLSDMIGRDFASVVKDDSTQARIAGGRLRNIQSALEKFAQKSPSRKQRRKAAHEVGILMDYLSPSVSEL